SSISIKLIAAGKGGWPIPPSAWAWRLGEFVEGRGMQTFDHGHHLWSTARFLLGPIEKVSAWIGTTASVIDSPAVIMWKYRDREAFGLCEYVYSQEMEIPSRYYANDEWIQVSGSAGLLTINRCTGELVDGPSVSLFSRNGWRHFQIPSDWKLGFIGSAWNFVRAIRGEEEPALSFPMAMEILSVDLAIARSAATGREVRLKPDGAILPPVAAYLKRRGEIRKARAARDFLTQAEGVDSSAESARFAVQLTSELPARLAARAVIKEGLAIGLELSGVVFPECLKMMSIIIKGGDVQVEEDRLPENPDLLIKTSAGIWAGILSGKQSVEKAYLHGRLKFVGPAETALVLKKLFSL
ncbi:MAG: SCP2 sterol-binding domain-containing protein, partial [Spirochaetes bacterium]|nr:SCP2 sterol-binding domain-containing protein [Spirochaetota bacterium]